MVNSGSSANLLVVDALLRRSQVEAPLRPGDEVLVPGLAWPTTVWPLVQLGLTPVFVDIDPVTLSIDLESAHAALGPRTRAMFLVHVLGRAADMTALGRFCADHGLHLLEDSCESLGAHWAERHVGTFGLAGSFSFYFSHHVSTIEGGMVVTNDPVLHDDLLSLRAHGWVRERSDRPRWAERFPGLDERFQLVPVLLELFLSMSLFPAHDSFLHLSTNRGHESREVALHHVVMNARLHCLHRCFFAYYARDDYEWDIYVFLFEDLDGTKGIKIRH